MPTLYSSVIHLTNVHPVALAHLGGQYGHAAFLEIVQAVDPALSAQLHDAKGRKPFTVSALQGLPVRKQRVASSPQNGSSQRHAQEEIHLREGWECWLRVTILDEKLFGAFISHFLLGAARPQIRLGEAHFLVSEILTMPGSHPWAGYTTLEELQTRLEQPVPRKLAFELFSPTQFGYQDDWKILMPLPRFVFGNLANAWKALTGEDNVRAVEEYAEANLIFGNYALKTENALIENKPHPGAVGKFEYLLTDKTDQPLARGLNLLADLAFYTGLGRKTPQGLGMACRMR